MNLSLKPETEKLIKERVERGEYRDAAELCEAFRRGSNGSGASGQLGARD